MGRPALRKLGHSPAALFGLSALSLVVLAAVAAPLVAPHDPGAQNLHERLQPPFGTRERHFLGTDNLGRDILSNIIYGSRISLTVSVLAVSLAGSIGVGLGLASGYYGGWIDDILSWIVNLQLSFPSLLLAIAVAAVLGPSLRNVVIVLTVTSWMTYTRVVRGQTLALREQEFVESARAIGCGNGRVVFRHILPNLIAPVIVISSFQAAQALITEAALSFLGLGIQAGIPSWGRMLADGRAYLATAWWLATFPGFAIMITVLSLNLLGDWLRDVLDPRLQRM